MWHGWAWMGTQMKRDTSYNLQHIWASIGMHSIQMHSMHIMLLNERFVRDNFTSDNAAVWHQIIAGAHGNNGALSTTTRIAMHAGKHGMMDEHGLKG